MEKDDKKDSSIVQNLLKIELKSDLICGSGSGFGSYVNNDITYDNYGFPYIPSKRIKGILKEAAVDYQELTNSDRNYALEIFGDDENEGHDFILHNAELENIDALHKEIDNIESKWKKYVSLVNVLSYYTSIRYQTMIDENGISKESCFRSSRVINRGNVFYAFIQYQKEDAAVLKDIISLVHHIGLNRNKGFGDVDLSLISYKEKKQKKLFINYRNRYDEYDIYLKMTAQSPIIIHSLNEQLLDYIPASNIQGYFIQQYLKNNVCDNDFYRLFFSNSLRFSNGYITDKNANSYYPMKESIYKDKENENYFYDLSIEKPINITLSKEKNKYITEIENNTYIKDVKKEIIYHHRRPNDKTIGHVVKNEDGLGTFYQVSAISPHQSFLAKISGSADDLKKLSLYDQFYMQIGASKYTQYGNIEVECFVKPKETISTIQSNEVICVLKENVLLLNERLESDLSTSSLLDTLGFEEVTDIFINYTKIGGYNNKWKLQRNSYDCFKAGSVIKGKLKETNLPVPALKIIGEMTNVGLGLVEYQEIKERQIKDEEPNDLNINDAPLNYSKGIVVNALKREMESKIIEKVNTMENKNLSSNTIGHLLTAIHYKKSWKEFINTIESYKDEDKRKKLIGIFDDLRVQCDKLNNESLLEKEDFYLMMAEYFLTKEKLERRQK